MQLVKKLMYSACVSVVVGRRRPVQLSAMLELSASAVAAGKFDVPYMSGKEDEHAIKL